MATSPNRPVNGTERVGLFDTFRRLPRSLAGLVALLPPSPLPPEQNIRVLEAVWFDVAGPHAMQAKPSAS
ncbi:hypothetical protein [Pontimonas sp.]|uniref:hypothetical protein n=1 Tax=Pontimonas sp. TaxID=2304492 RepID=UPI0028700BB0|nr:hypothetical protein [Pontimonas sp.]MDR9433814.1 hypothetical protein [Pontimonas sp.]